MERLRFATVGSVDDGKSTLIGRLLYDSKSIFEDQLEHIEAVSKRRGDDYVDLSLLTDGLRAEREQGITIDVAYRYFATPKRSFIIADCPGHIQYTRNMITGASNVDLAIVLIDARTGAHEVITTIMLNNMAAFFILWLLKTNLFQREDRTDPISKLVSAEGRMPRLFGFMDGRSDLVAHIGFIVAIAAVVVYWWFLKKTTTGFEFRAYGLNADAATYAGMHVKRLTVLSMMFAGGFAGLAGAAEVLGTYGYASTNFAGNIGFDAIAIALLGQSSPMGTLFAAILFGALQAGGRQMQTNSDVPIDLIVVLRALIVMFIAAPLLIKTIWRIKSAQISTGQTFRGWGS